ncbi:MAG: hypothetical protein M1822_007553 [Bathelium mastoideum]|nr:MAG: hypothetical protein M1822_007553 [Bathelium mastoideum]
MFEAKFVTKYLEDYVDSHIYDGISLRGRVIFGYRVEKVEKIKDAWIINPGRLPSEPGRKTIASKLVVATGVTSIPNMPSLPTQEKFAGPIIHHKQFGQFSRSAMHDVNCRHIAVLGAGKSSVDMVYECIKKNKIVNWIIRLKGEGPALFTLPAGTGRYRNSVERNSTRLNASLSPSSFMPDFWLLKFFHRSNYGKNYVRQRIQNTDEICRKTAAYQTREAALPGFRELQPTTS